MKLTDDQAEEVRFELRENELEIKQIAKMFKVSVHTVALINRGLRHYVPRYNYPVRKISNQKDLRYKEPGYRSKFWDNYYPESQSILDE